jgi:hypothetical protein
VPHDPWNCMTGTGLLAPEGAHRIEP